MRIRTLQPHRLRAFALAMLAVLPGGCDGDALPTPPADGNAKQGPGARPGVARAPSEVGPTLANAIRTRARDVWVDGSGSVIRILRDDTEGSPHQRFLIRLGDGTTVLVAHNIALAPRLAGLRTGEVVEFRGQYIWSRQGGTLHWTHRDPDGDRPGGWLRWRGRTYE